MISRQSSTRSQNCTSKSGLGFQGLLFQGSDGVQGLGFGAWVLGFGVWGLGFWAWGLGFGVWGLGFGVVGSRGWASGRVVFGG